MSKQIKSKGGLDNMLHNKNTQSHPNLHKKNMSSESEENIVISEEMNEFEDNNSGVLNEDENPFEPAKKDIHEYLNENM